MDGKDQSQPLTSPTPTSPQKKNKVHNDKTTMFTKRRRWKKSRRCSYFEWMVYQAETHDNQRQTMAISENVNYQQIDMEFQTKQTKAQRQQQEKQQQKATHILENGGNKHFNANHEVLKISRHIINRVCICVINHIGFGQHRQDNGLNGGYQHHHFDLKNWSSQLQLIKTGQSKPIFNNRQKKNSYLPQAACSQH